MIYDALIIGSGPAGMSAAIYLQNANKNICIIEKNVPGGKILKAKKINNYLGFNKDDSSALAYDMYSQIENLKIPLFIDSVISIIDGEIKTIITKNNEYKAKNIIVACGRNEKSLGITNEEELIGKGISYCVTCDGSLYKNKAVALIGNSEQSLTELLYLKGITNNIIYINYSKNEITDSKIRIINNHNVIEIKKENKKIKSLIMDDNEEIIIDGLFISTGYIPNINILKNINVNEKNNYIIVDNNMKTNIDGIYAVGDIIKKDLYQIVTAAAEGAIAATSIIKNM